jgi:hypothetical protein
VVAVKKLYQWFRVKAYGAFLVFSAEGEDFPKRHITVNARPSFAAQKPLGYNASTHREVWTLLWYAIVGAGYVGILTILSILTEIRLHQTLAIAVADSGLH